MDDPIHVFSQLLKHIRQPPVKYYRHTIPCSLCVRVYLMEIVVCVNLMRNIALFNHTRVFGLFDFINCALRIVSDSDYCSRWIWKIFGQIFSQFIFLDIRKWVVIPLSRQSQMPMLMLRKMTIILRKWLQFVECNFVRSNLTDFSLYSPGIMSAIMRRQLLHQMVKNLPKPVQGRISALKNVQLKQMHLEAKFYEEVNRTRFSFSIKFS